MNKAIHAGSYADFDGEDNLWLEWLYKAEQSVCKHPKEHWHDESWANGDSGGDGGHCGLCEWGYSVVMY